jgi:hypothetical protein
LSSYMATCSRTRGSVSSIRTSGPVHPVFAINHIGIKRKTTLVTMPTKRALTQRITERIVPCRFSGTGPTDVAIVMPFSARTSRWYPKEDDILSQKAAQTYRAAGLTTVGPECCQRPVSPCVRLTTACRQGSSRARRGLVYLRPMNYKVSLDCAGAKRYISRLIRS